ncbi:MAG TPA: hypothetical protein VK658_03515 [Chryseolinea sp.]|nr:hypothetical protein [Chryseolinea sp.]
MAKVPKSTFKIRYYSKYVALAFIIIGMPVMIFDNAARSEIPLLIGLFMLLITAERHDDERSVQIKNSSLYIAFIVAYSAKLITTSLHDHNLTSFELTEINHFLIFMLALANIIFYSRLHILKQ